MVTTKPVAREQSVAITVRDTAIGIAANVTRKLSRSFIRIAAI